ncbi:Glycosyltransferase [Desulfovibrionales bacterium]
MLDAIEAQSHNYMCLFMKSRKRGSGGYVRKRTKNWLNARLAMPYSQLWLTDNGENWSLKWDALAVDSLARYLGVPTWLAEPHGVTRQSIFYLSKYVLLEPERYLANGNRIAFPYYHGYPGSDCPVAERCFKALRQLHPRVSRLQVSHARMEQHLLEAGVAPEKIHRIPIGVDCNLFTPQTSEGKRQARERWGVPLSAVVVGSFQKDGNGWGKGMSPKLIKGPDIFLATMKTLKTRVSELFVLLSGPARGYVKQGLEHLGLPYRHVFLENYLDIGTLYHCLDVYLVASREEGGPKAVLESMAAGIPLVTTRVGQVMDLVRSGDNGLLSDIGDYAGLAHALEQILGDTSLRERLIITGLATARTNTYLSQLPLWRHFFDGFVALPVSKKTNPDIGYRL